MNSKVKVGNKNIITIWRIAQILLSIMFSFAVGLSLRYKIFNKPVPNSAQLNYGSILFVLLFLTAILLAIKNIEKRIDMLHEIQASDWLSDTKNIVSAGYSVIYKLVTLIGSLLFITGCLKIIEFYLINSKSFTDWVIAFFSLDIAVLGILLGSYGLYSFFKMNMIDFAIKLDSTGIHHFQYGFIPWKDVISIETEVKIIRWSKQINLIIEVIDPDNYRLRLNKFQNYLYKLDIFFSGRTNILQISLNGLTIKPLYLSAFAEKLFAEEKAQIASKPEHDHW